jgi:hypothetical protein
MRVVRSQLVRLLCLAIFAWPLIAGSFSPAAAVGLSTAAPNVPEEEETGKEQPKLETALVVKLHAHRHGDRFTRPAAHLPHPGGRPSSSHTVSSVAPAPFGDAANARLRC